jgi:hypothetical protein
MLNSSRLSGWVWRFHSGSRRSSQHHILWWWIKMHRGEWGQCFHRPLQSRLECAGDSKRRRHPYHAASSDEEALWVDREHHLTLLARVVSLGHLQRRLDALSQRRHLEPSGAAPNLYCDLYHALVLSYRPVKKQCMAGCEASASARWLSFCRPCSHFFGL